MLRTALYAGGNTAYPLDAALSAQQTIATGIAATAGGNQSTAYALTAAINEITTCATNGDSVKLPLAVAGLGIAVFNLGAASCQVYGSGTDTINAVATATGVALATTKNALFICTASAPAGKWRMVLTA